MDVYAAALKQYRQATRLRICLGTEVLSPQTNTIIELLVSHPGLRGLYFEAGNNKSYARARSGSAEDSLHEWKAALTPLQGMRVKDELYFAFKIYCRDENQRWGRMYFDREVREKRTIAPLLEFAKFLVDLRETMGGVQRGHVGGIRGRRGNTVDILKGSIGVGR